LANVFGRSGGVETTEICFLFPALPGYYTIISQVPTTCCVHLHAREQTADKTRRHRCDNLLWHTARFYLYTGYAHVTMCENTTCNKIVRGKTNKPSQLQSHVDDYNEVPLWSYDIMTMAVMRILRIFFK